MSYSYNQPDKDLRYAYISSPRVYAAEYDAGNPPTYDGESLVSMSTAPTGGSFIDCGVLAAVALPLTKNFTHRELGVPKTRRKSWEISRDSRVEFTLTEMIPETIGLLFGFTNTNKLKTTAATQLSAATRTQITVTSATGLTVGTRICSAATSTEAALRASNNRAVISAVDGTTITLAGTGFPTAPGATDYVRGYSSIEMLDTMGEINYRSVLVFWDWVEDSKQRQAAVFYPKMSATGAFSPDFKDGANPTDVKATLEALATEQTVEDGTTALVDRITYMFD